MALNHPGIAVAEQVTASSALQTDSLPLFIGFATQGLVGQPRPVTSPTDFVQQFGTGFPTRPEAAYLYRAVKSFFDCGGSWCHVLSLGSGTTVDLAGTLHRQFDAIGETVKSDAKAALIACPDMFAVADDTQRATLWKAMLSLCGRLPNAFALLDLPHDLALAETFLSTVDLGGAAPYGAAYWPPMIDRSAGAGPEAAWLTPSCGAIAALYQRVDRERGVWHAPANVALSTPWWPAVEAAVPDDALFCRGAAELSANVIRSRSGRGARIWGARTLAPASMPAMRYIQQRRLLSHIEAYLRDAGQFALFEPNNELTWLKLRSIASTFLHNLWRGGALAGSSEAEAYRVAIGLGQTMADADIDAGRMILGIDVATLVPAEFISISIDYLRS